MVYVHVNEIFAYIHQQMALQAGRSSQVWSDSLESWTYTKQRIFLTYSEK